MKYMGTLMVIFKSFIEPAGNEKKLWKKFHYLVLIINLHKQVFCWTKNTKQNFEEE